MIFKEIKLYPTLYWLDIWYAKSKEEAVQAFSRRYGQSAECYDRWIVENMTGVVKSTEESELRGEERIVVLLSSMDSDILIHEATHVLFKLNKLVHVEINNKSQEWCAYMIEYIYKELELIKKEEQKLVTLAK